jgi:PRTRC genetic system protein C
MALETTKLKRVFEYETKKEGTITLNDPNPALSPDEVLDHYSSDYPQLQNAVVLPGEVKGDTMVFTIKDNFGDKG